MSTKAEDLFRIERSDKVGRYAVAKQDLKPGDTIFSETPFAYGPKADTYPLCLGCYNGVDGTVTCTTCGWPVCGPDCEKLPAHKDAECVVFSKAGVKFQPVEDFSSVCLQYECIMPLRVLLAKEADPERWEEEIQHMEHHNEIRKGKPVWEFNQVNIVNYLRGPCKLDRFPEELIHTVCGIIDVNAFEARSPYGYPIRCLYPKLAILSHNCVSNICHSINTLGTGTKDDYTVTVRASVAVKEGEQLYSSYTYSLWPTLVRREFLKESKYFDCKCERCADPSELGTNLSSLKCQKCDNGIIRSSDPLDTSAIWKCTHCEFTTKGEAVRKVFVAIQADLDAADEHGMTPQAIEVREQLFKKYRSVLHPKNAYMCMMRSALGTLYGKVDGYTLEDLPDLLLERKIEMCQMLLEVIDVIEPGYSRLRGMTLYELHAPLLFHARSQYRQDMINEEQLRQKIDEAIKILEESAKILSLEPLSTQEGVIGQGALQSLEQLKANIDAFIDSI